MKVLKVINNNVVTVIDDRGKEVIVTGCGIGFGKKPGQSVDESKVEKIYRMESEESLEKFKELLKGLPLEHIQVCNEIIAFTKESLSMPINQNIYITLTDHISFAINRYKEGTFFKNALTNEIQYFYPGEYAIGKHALDLIEKKTGIRLPEDEASSIANHIVNAELNLKVSDSFRLITAAQKILDMMQKEMWFPEEETYERRLFLTNLKFLVHRVMFGTRKNVEDPKLSDFIRNNYRTEYEQAEKVKDFLWEEYQCEMQPDEVIYLALDIKRLRENSERKDDTYGII
ncbi:MAG: PRD domain-containing protein [Clostridiales bacterium]|nr:PRD domain-containing protein [Clostridiales bacterium]